MNIIALVDSNFALSNKGRILASIPADRKLRFEETRGKVIVYGIGYVQELPGQQPVADSVNVIFTDGVKTPVKQAKNVILADTLDEVRKALKPFKDDDIYIIDNEKLYREFLKDTKTCHITKIDYEYEADAHMDNLDKNPDFEITADSDELYCFDIVYNFLKYERKA